MAEEKTRFSALEIGQIFRYRGEAYRKVTKDWGELIVGNRIGDAAIVHTFYPEVLVELCEEGLDVGDVGESA